MANYGTAQSCVTDIEGRTVSGNRVVAEALARRLRTPRGRLIGYPNYGYDLTQYVNADMSPRDIAALCAGARNECMQDERVIGAVVSAVLGKDGILTVAIDVVGALGPFQMTLAVSSVTVNLLSVT